VDTISDPVETHANGLEAALFDGNIGYTGGAGIIGLHEGSGLRMTHTC
jgi:hypothetical protein